MRRRTTGQGAVRPSTLCVDHRSTRGGAPNRTIRPDTGQNCPICRHLAPVELGHVLLTRERRPVRFVIDDQNFFFRGRTSRSTCPDTTCGPSGPTTVPTIGTSARPPSANIGAKSASIITAKTSSSLWRPVAQVPVHVAVAQDTADSLSAAVASARSARSQVSNV